MSSPNTSSFLPFPPSDHRLTCLKAFPLTAGSDLGDDEVDGNGGVS